MTNKCEIQSEEINGAVGEPAIADVWSKHYSEIRNSKKDIQYKPSVLNKMRSIPVNSNVKVHVNEVKETIDKLKAGKGAGRESLQSEHFKYASPVLSVLMTSVINAMIVHGYMPKSAMDSVIVPILKDKKGSINDKSNYRPIAMTTVFSKLFESVILNKYADLLMSLDNQFGFKAGSSTDQCVFMLKQIIEFYNNLGSPVYICFLDASKAFDKLNQWALFFKLILRGIPCVIVRIFVFWYQHQQFYVRWGNTLSSSFHTINGVRQGGIISPSFFNVYMDHLSHALNLSGTGCHFNGSIANHLMYADDCCLIAPSPAALQHLLDICASYASHFTLVYNELKSKCMVVKPRSLSAISVPSFSLNDKVLPCVTDMKYLGVILSCDMSDDTDLNRHRKYIYRQGNMLIRLFKCCSDSVKIKLFNTFCVNTYCGHLWTRYSTSAMKKLVVAFNDIYRKLFGISRGVSMSAIYVTNNVNSLGVLLRLSAGTFRARPHIAKTNSSYPL